MSKGQEALKELGECLLLEGALDIINQERIGFIAKELRALEIINKKIVNVYEELYNTENYKDYKLTFDYISKDMQLTQEEYEFLKEVLNA